tara:strand:+ start:1047 stop:1946 length:900 start_codon:yes stop_codon:yes gene_type:complete
MKLLKLIYFFSICLFSQEIDVKIDTNLLRIGEQFSISLYNQNFDTISDYEDVILSILDDFEIIKQKSFSSYSEGDSIYVSEYLLTKFDTGKFKLPSIIDVNNLNKEVDSIELEFIPVLIDTTNNFFDIKKNIDAPFKINELLYYKKYFFLLILLLLILYLIYRKSLTKKLDKKYEVKKEIQIDIYFLEELDNLNSKKYLENNKFKLYFTRLSEIFRGYLEVRFHLNALELTSSELKQELEKLKLQEDWVNNFLRTGDLVKFAKATPDVKKSETFLKNVKDFIIKHKVNLNNQNENKNAN